MHRLPGLLLAVGTVIFVLGVLRIVLGRAVFGFGLFGVPGESYWRAAVFLVLLAIALVSLGRSPRSG